MDLNRIKNKSLQVDALVRQLDELRYRYAILNGGTQSNFKLTVDGKDFEISHMDRGYMQTFRPHYEKLRAVLQAAISDHILEVEQYIAIAKEELKAIATEELAKL